MAQLFADRCREVSDGRSAAAGWLAVVALWLSATRDAVVHGLLARGAGPSSPAPTEPDDEPNSGRSKAAVSREPLLVTAWHDTRLAMRSLRASPGLTGIALTSLTLGIGASTAIFTLINAVVLRPLPVTDPDALVMVRTTGGGFDTERMPNPMWESLRDRQEVFDDLAANAPVYFNVGAEPDSERTLGAWASGDFFRTLGLLPAAGRLLEPGDDRRGCPGVVVLGHGYWTRAYGADASAVGRQMIVNGHAFDIVGVAPVGFTGLTLEAVTELYLPVCAEAVVRGERSALDAGRTWFLRVVGRLPAGVTTLQAEAELAAVMPAVLEDAVPLDWSASRQEEFFTRAVAVSPAGTGFSGLRSVYQRSLFVLLAAVGVVMLVVCTNLANLMLARAARRRREISMRVALGATRLRLVQQVLVESLLLAGLGAVAGGGLALWVSRVLVRTITPPGESMPLDLGPDLRVLGFLSAVTLLTGVLFGLVPALHAARVDPHIALKGVGGASRGGASLRGGGSLVAAQVMLSLVLLTGAALLIGTFRHLDTLDPGFDRDRVLLVNADIRRADLTAEQQRQTYLDLLQELRAVPGLRSVSFAEVTPVSGNSVTEFVVRAGYESLLDEDAEVYTHRVGDGYFSSLGAPVVRGRDFAPADADGEPVAIINQSMARLVFGEGVDAVGRRFHRRLSDTEVSDSFLVVGVVRDAKYRTLRDDALPTVYFSLPQQPAFYFGSSLTYQLLPEDDVEPPLAVIRAAVEGAVTGARARITPLSERLSASLARERLLALISGFFGGLALFLAVIGLYGVMAFNVSRRLREIGVRLALGSSRRGVFGLVLAHAAVPVAVGLVLGGLAGIVAARTLESLLYGIRATDPRILLLAATTLALAAMLSAAIPARRASRLDPAVVLRQDAT